MFVVPNFPHLHGIELEVSYNELREPRLPSMTGASLGQMKWKESMPTRTRAPAPKVYLNGALMKEALQPYTPLLKVPPHTNKYPRREGLTRVYPTDPDYEEICRKQGLRHLLTGYQESSSQDQPAKEITPPKSEESINGGSPRFSISEPQPLPNGLGSHATSPGSLG